MTTTELPGSAVPLNKGLLLTGAALVAAGGMLAATGILLETVAVTSALRRWSRGLPTPPRELARHRLNQARVAGTAAVDAWRTSPDAGRTAGLRS